VERASSWLSSLVSAQGRAATKWRATVGSGLASGDLEQRTQGAIDVIVDRVIT